MTQHYLREDRVGQLTRFSIAMDDDLLTDFDDLVKNRGLGINRSEAVRDLVRDALVEGQWEDATEEIVGTVTMVFDHHVSDLSEKLDALQHSHHDKIVATMHVHLDAHNCLEVLVVRGPSGDIKAIADALLGTKGVKHGKLVMTTTGVQI